MGKNTDDSTTYNAVAVDLSSDTTPAPGVRGVYVGTAGTLKVDLAGGATAISYKNLAAGVFHGLQIAKVYSTTNGTTATDVVLSY